MIGWRLTVIQAGGGLKDRSAIQWRDEYHKRFRRFGQMTLVEKKFKPDQDVFAGYGQAFKVILDERGKQTDSPGLAKWLGDWTARHGHIVFAIGDAYGHSAATKQSADTAWSLSSLYCLINWLMFWWLNNFIALPRYLQGCRTIMDSF